MLFTISMTKNKEFLTLYKKGKSIGSKACVFYFLPNRLPFNRLGITTSKKVGNAVARNRAKRIIKAAYQQNEIQFPVGFDFVIVARESATQVKSDEIVDFFNKRVFLELKRFKPNENSQHSKKGKNLK